MEKIKDSAALVLILAGMFMPVIGVFAMPDLECAIAFALSGFFPVAAGCALVN